MVGLAHEALQFLADGGVNLGDIGHGRGQARADGPDWLISNHEVAAVRIDRDRAAQLLAHHGEGFARFPLLAGFAYAYDSRKACPVGGDRLGAYIGVLFPVVLAALGMADENVGGACIGQHLGGNVARVGARFLGVAILAADGDAGADGAIGEGADQGGRRANGQVHLGFQARRVTGMNLVQHPGGRLQTVHFPVSRHQRARPIDAHFLTPVTLDNLAVAEA